MSIQNEIDRLATVKADLKAAINGASGSTVGDIFGDYPGAITSGKSAIAAAITDKGVTTAADATFQQMAENIGAIQSGPDTAIVSVDLVYSGPHDVEPYGIYYISPDGQSLYSKLVSEHFTLSVMKGSFLVPCALGDVSKNEINGNLMAVSNFDLFINNTGYTSILVYVAGDGSISM